MGEEKRRELYERLRLLRETNSRYWIERYSNPAEIERMTKNETELERPKRRTR
jgi:hypothetical protein